MNNVDVCVKHSYARLTSTGTLTLVVATVYLKIASQTFSGAPTNVNAFAIRKTAQSTISGTLIHAVVNVFPKTVRRTSTGTKIFASVYVSTKTVQQAKFGILTNANVNVLLSSNAKLDFYGMTIFADASAHKPKNAHLTSTGIQSTVDAHASKMVLTAFLLISGTQ
jgi:hypothetical protein